MPKKNLPKEFLPDEDGDEPTKLHLTTAFINSREKPSKGKRKTYTDECDRSSDKDSYTGLQLRINDKGEKTFRFRYGIKGHGGTAENGRQLKGDTHSLTLGEYPNMKLKDARAKAREFYKLANEGQDPADKMAKEIEGRREQEANTFERVARLYLEMATKPQRKKIGKKGPISETVKKQRQTDLNDVVFPVLGDKPIADIGESEIEAFLDDLELHPRSIKYPSRVDRMLDVIRAVFYFAKKKKYIDSNPTIEIEDRYAHTDRDRWLKDNELKAMWKATEGLGNFGQIIRFLALTAQRSGEVRGMTWRDVDLERAVWTIPAKKNKSRRVHQIPLSTPALKIIEGQPRGKPGDYVFHGKGGGDKMTSTTPKQTVPLYENMLEILREDDPEAELEHWVPHDLRRTAKTNFASLGIPIHIYDLICNHNSPRLGGMDDVYNKHLYESEIRSALDKWSLKLRGIVSGIEVVKETA